MSKFEQIQTRKAIGAYGGVGSILETRDGAIMIDSFDEWPYFLSIDEDFKEHNLVVDTRFKNRLSKYFLQLEHLVKIPVNDIQKGFKPENNFAFLSAKYFPQWFYCNSCHKFDNLPNWRKNWNDNVKPKLKESEYRDKDDYFYPPKCYKCYLKNQNKKKKFFELEQVRFILTAPNGDISDIPWDRWAMFKAKITQLKKEKKKDSSIEDEKIEFENIEFPSNYSLQFITSDRIDDLSGIGIKIIDESLRDAKSNQVAYVTLSGLFSIIFKKKDLFANCSTEEVEILFKPVIRTSNSVYYPNILSSIYLPDIDELNSFKISLIKEAHEDGDSAENISKNLRRYKSLNIEVETIQRLIENNFCLREAEISKSENEYRYDEYKYIANNENENIEDKLKFNKIDSSFYQKEYIKAIYKVDKLKIISVQTSYTRQEPISIDLYLKDDSEIKGTQASIRKKYTSKKGIETKYLPAIESYGEGLFFNFDINNLKDWELKNPTISNRVQSIIENHLNSESPLNKDLKVTPQFILLHTFSHLIIKELEYLCGYPATSIQERLYIDDDLGMYGLLIYTTAGSEGSYGGLTSIGQSDKMGKLIESALIRAQDCATDPICYHSSGQGVGGLNLSSCFSCTLLPETSCEMFNCFLDRRLLIDKDFGYFKDVLNKKN